MQRNRGKDGEHVFAFDMRACTEEDFSARGYTPDEGMMVKIKQRIFLCFDTSGPNGFEFDIVNLYNADLRHMFQVNVLTCDRARRNCKSDEEQKELLKNQYFNLFILQQRAELGKTGTIDMLKT